MQPKADMVSKECGFNQPETVYIEEEEEEETLFVNGIVTVGPRCSLAQ